MALAAIAFGPGWISAWWLIAPLVAFIALAVAFDRLDRSLKAAIRGTSYYERALARIEDRWPGTGSTGDAFRDPKHLYAEDLDLFGRASLFELLSTARTAAGERILASWLLGPGELDAVLARQQAVAELRDRLDLREEIALMGEEVRAAVDDRALETWGSRPRVEFFRGARVIALILATAAVVTFALWLGQIVTLRPFLAIFLAEVIFGFAVRASVVSVVGAVNTPSRELELLGLLLQSVERGTFTSRALVALHAAIQVESQPASKHIDRLGGLVHHLYSARNQFFGIIAMPLLWVPQFAMAVESWRIRYGPHIGRWTAAVGEFEALCSLASFAF